MLSENYNSMNIIVSLHFLLSVKYDSERDSCFTTQSIAVISSGSGLSVPEILSCFIVDLIVIYIFRMLNLQSL